MDDNGNPIPRDARGEEENQNLNPPTTQKTIIFRIEGGWDEIEPAFVEHRRRRDLRSFKWMGRVIIRVPGQTTPSGTSWEQFITSLRKKTEFTIEKQERLKEAAQKLHRDWNSLFSEADQMVINFLQFIARTRADQRMRDDPTINLKVITIALNVISLLETNMPQGPITDTWLQSTWEKIFEGKAPHDLDFLKLIKFILADGLNIPPLDVNAALQIRGIQPTPFSKEEFFKFCQSGSFEEHESQTFHAPSREEEDAGDEEEEDRKKRWWQMFFPEYIDEKDAEAYL